jgi:hypothetical protein
MKAEKQILAENFRLNSSNKAKSKVLDKISGKTSFIFRKIGVFFILNGIFPFIFQTQKRQYLTLLTISMKSFDTRDKVFRLL